MIPVFEPSLDEGNFQAIASTFQILQHCEGFTSTETIGLNTWHVVTIARRCAA